MIIDIVLIAFALIALIVGWRKGFIVQLLQLIGLYIAVLIAPDFANEVGEIFTDDPGLAYDANGTIRRQCTAAPVTTVLTADATSGAPAICKNIANGNAGGMIK